MSGMKTIDDNRPVHLLWSKENRASQGRGSIWSKRSVVCTGARAPEADISPGVP